MNNPESIDLTLIEDRKKLAESLIVDIDDWSEQHYAEGPRKHLGASEIGKTCSRELWYKFHWAKREEYGKGTSKSAGQLLRLFQRGHNEETGIIEYLKGIGCTFEATPEDQIRISDVGGHFGGSMDNVGTLPPRYGISERVLFEFKTSNMAEFNKLKKNGMIAHKPIHYSQMCVYGFKMNLNYGVYVCVDKNTDELYIEIIAINHDHGRQMIDKATVIITTKEPPAKFSLSPTNFVCKWCNFSDICHNEEPVAKNCRSCIHATAADGQLWLCGLAGNAAIPEHVIPVGCPSHEGID